MSVVDARTVADLRRDPILAQALDEAVAADHEKIFIRGLDATMEEVGFWVRGRFAAAVCGYCQRRQPQDLALARAIWRLRRVLREHAGIPLMLSTMGYRLPRGTISGGAHVSN